MRAAFVDGNPLNDYTLPLIALVRGKKGTHKDVFERLKNDWMVWNDTMLAERPRPAPYNNPGNFLADHYGVVNPASTPAPASAAQR